MCTNLDVVMTYPKLFPTFGIVAILTKSRSSQFFDCVSSIISTPEFAQGLFDLLVVKTGNADYADLWLSSIDFTDRVSVVRSESEHIPGGRNKALDVCFSNPSVEYIAFVDDDEVVTNGWLRSLLETQVSCSADLVRGKVHRVFDDHACSTLKLLYGKEPSFTNGAAIKLISTDNLLIMRQAAMVRFDDSLRYSGGSDVKFGLDCLSAGCRIVACDKSLVRELQTPERQELGWWISRSYRDGVNEVLIARQTVPCFWSNRLSMLIVKNLLRICAVPFRSKLSYNVADHLFRCGMARFSGSLRAAFGRTEPKYYE